jgi:dolichol kinase
MYFSLKAEALNNIFGFTALFLVLFHILLFLIIMYQDSILHNDLVPGFLFGFGFPILLNILVLVITSLITMLYRKNFSSNKIATYKIKVEKSVAERSKCRNDTYRKIPHVLIFVGLLILWLISVVVINDLTGSTEGMIVENSNIMHIYLELLTSTGNVKDILLKLGWFYYLLFFFFYIFCMFMLFNEYTRKSRIFTYPFNLFCSIFLCENERRSYGTYLYFAIGLMFASFISPPMVLFSILGICSISDLMTSQIGIRYGKRHIKWNKDKTWEGTLAGILSAFIICFLFVGLIWALIFTLIFFIFDIFTTKPVNISDNLIVPISCGIVYFFVRFIFDLDYTITFLKLFGV